MGWIQGLMGAAQPPAAPALPDDAVLIDVRSQGEFMSGHIEGALCLPLDRIQAGIAEVAPDLRTPLVLYCASGARSGRAREIVLRLGYTQVANGGGVGALALRLNRPIARA